MNHVLNTCMEYTDFSILFRDYFKIIKETPHLLTQFFQDKCLRGWQIKVDENDHVSLYDRAEHMDTICESKVTLIANEELGIAEALFSKDVISTAGSSNNIYEFPININEHPLSGPLEYILEYFKCGPKNLLDASPYKINKPIFKKIKKNEFENEQLISSHFENFLTVTTVVSSLAAAYQLFNIMRGKARVNNLFYLSLSVTLAFISVGLSSQK